MVQVLFSGCKNTWRRTIAMCDHTDPAWEEYLSTGIDPTGGELGPDFDPETDEPLEEDETDEE